MIQNLFLKRYAILALLFAFFFLAPSLSALEIPKRPEGYVSDYAGMISSSTRFELEKKLRRFEQETSNQVVVVTFPSLETESLEDFSIRLAETWKIGQKEKNNGVVLLIFQTDRKVRIEVGYGLEGALPDATSKVIIENEIVPRFREGKFDEGIEKAVDAIIAATKGEYQAQSPSINWWYMIGASILWPLILIFGFYNVIKRFSKGYVITRSGRRSWGSGGGGFGGGFGGGGGGGFGGGGASGGW